MLTNYSQLFDHLKNNCYIMKAHNYESGWKIFKSGGEIGKYVSRKCKTKNRGWR